MSVTDSLTLSGPSILGKGRWWTIILHQWLVTRLYTCKRELSLRRTAVQGAWQDLNGNLVNKVMIWSLDECLASLWLLISLPPPLSSLFFIKPSYRFISKLLIKSKTTEHFFFIMKVWQCANLIWGLTVLDLKQNERSEAVKEQQNKTLLAWR